MTAARLFVALMAPQAVQAALVAHADAWRWPPAARRGAPERLHLTLAFLGDIDMARIDAVRDVLATVPCPRLAIRLDRCEVWPRVGAAVLRPAPQPLLARLQGDVVAALADVGFAPERRVWQPHVTLARHAAGAVPPASFAPVDWEAASFALVRSRLGPRPLYQTLLESPPLRV